MRRQLTKEDLRLMLIPKRYWDVSVRGLIGEYRGYIEEYIREMDRNMREGRGLYLFGPNGSGKTSASIVVMKEARRRGYNGLYVYSNDLHDIFLDKIYYSEEESLRIRMGRVDFLIIDDLGKGIWDKTGFMINRLEGILRERYNNNLVTWITSNMNPNELMGLFSDSGINVLKKIVYPIHYY